MNIISQLTNLCTGIRSWPPPINRQPFRCSFGCVLLWNQIYLVHNVPFDNIKPIYLINLPWKLGLGLGLDLKMHYFSIFTENKESEHIILREFHGR